jgi:hypothetical protein
MYPATLTGGANPGGYRGLQRRTVALLTAYRAWYRLGRRNPMSIYGPEWVTISKVATLATGLAKWSSQ